MGNQIHNQGYPVLLSHLAVAEEYCRQNGQKPNDANMMKAINKLAKEKAESYTPSPYLGENPGPRVAQSFKVMMGSRVTTMKSKAAKIEITGAVNHLTQVILKHSYGFKTTRRPNVDKSNPKELTDFEYLGKGSGNSFTKDQLSLYNKTVDANRHIRMLVEAWLYAAISLPMADTKYTWYNRLVAMGYKNIGANVLASAKKAKEVLSNALIWYWVKLEIYDPKKDKGMWAPLSALLVHVKLDSNTKKQKMIDSRASKIAQIKWPDPPKKP